MAGLHHTDWRDHIDAGRRHRARLEQDGERAIRRQARRLAGDPRVAAVCLSNEVPADVVRWLTTSGATCGVSRQRSVKRIPARW